MEKELKLFVWEGYLNSQEGDGIIFALAINVESAREAVKAKMKEDGYNEILYNENSDVGKALQSEPRVVFEQEGFMVFKRVFTQSINSHYQLLPDNI